MKITHVSTYIHPDHFGGAERVISGLAGAQARAGHEVTVLTGNHSQKQDEETRDGYRVVRYPVAKNSHGLSFMRSVARNVGAALSRPDVGVGDVLHAHQPASAVNALKARTGFNASVYSFYAPFHAEFSVEKGLDGQGDTRPRLRDHIGRFFARRLDQKLLKLADRVIVLSNFSAQQIQDLAPEQQTKVKTVPPGIDPLFSVGDRTKARQRWNWPEDHIKIVTVRRLVRRMGIDEAIITMHAALNKIPNLTLEIAGDGPERGRLESLTRALGIDDRIRFMGNIAEDDLPDLYRAADLFLLPTRALEGFGMATLEALACGTPVVASNVGATPELIARLCPEISCVPAGRTELLKGIRHSVRGLSKLKQAATRAASRVQNDFNWTHCVEELNSVYQDAIAGKAH